jgi:hypothetical protein
MLIKGKLNRFDVDDIHRIAPDLDTSDFVDIVPYYDALEEEMLEQGFVLWDDDLVFDREVVNSRYHEKRYNIAVVRGTQRDDKFIVKDISISYKGIKNNKMNDLERLSYARNHLRVPTINGKPEEDGLKAFRYLDEYIKKMQEMGVKNIKELLK